MRVIAAILICATLFGCASTSIPVEVPKYHSEMPTPYTPCIVHWNVLEVDKTAKVALSYNDNVTAAICNKDLQRVLSEYKTLLCYYRAELKEKQCIKDINETN